VLGKASVLDTVTVTTSSEEAETRLEVVFDFTALYLEKGER